MNKFKLFFFLIRFKLLSVNCFIEVTFNHCYLHRMTADLSIAMVSFSTYFMSNERLTSQKRLSKRIQRPSRAQIKLFTGLKLPQIPQYHTQSRYFLRTKRQCSVSTFNPNIRLILSTKLAFGSSL